MTCRASGAIRATALRVCHRVGPTLLTMYSPYRAYRA